MEEKGYDKVFRITDYEHPFDNYKGQETIVFEEFRSSLKIQDMLNYLDGYPVELPCRYNNKIACYTKVYLISNIPLNEQYRNVQIESRETWKALLRRINKVKEYKKKQNKFYIEEYGTEEYLKDNIKKEQKDCPWLDND